MRRLITLISMLSLVGFVAVGCGAAEEAAEEAGQAVEEAVEDVEEAVEEAVEGVEEVVEEVEDAMTGETDIFSHEEAAQGGTLVIGQNQEPDTLYLYGGSMLAGSFIQNSLYETIEGLNYDYQAVILEKLPKIENGGAVLGMTSVEAGDLYVDAETQEVVTATETIADLPQLTVTFELVDGLAWQDGTPVTAGDSVFSRELACHPDSPTSKYTCERTVSYEATDDSTMVWTGLPGFTDQTYFTNFYTPLPRHQESAEGTPMSEMEPTTILEDENFTRKPYSYGPFMIAEWESGEKISLERNENYWRADEGLPYLDQVIHRFIPDSNALLAAIKSGDIDVATQSGMGLDQFDALTEAEAAGELTPYYVVGTVWEHIDFNLNPIDDRAAVGACKEVRQAVAFGTDRQNMVDVIQKGKTLVQNTYVPAEHWAYPEEGLKIYDYNPDQAMELLEGIGFTDADGDGVREAAEDITCTITTDIDGNTKDQVIPAGTALEMTLNTTEGNQMREESTLLFQQNMADIGLKVNLEYLAANIYFEDGPDGPLFGRRFDLGQFAWLTGVQPPVGLYWCTEIPSEENAWAGQNETGWCDPEYDMIAKQADNTLERAQALPAYHQAQQMFSENLPVLPLFARVKVMATTPDVVNFAPNPTVNAETWNIETWGFAKTE